MRCERRGGVVSGERRGGVVRCGRSEWCEVVRCERSGERGGEEWWGVRGAVVRCEGRSGGV